MTYYVSNGTLNPTHSLRPRRGAVYCDQPVCASVCPGAYLWNRWTDSTNFCVRIPVAVARSSSRGVALRYVLPVLWMTLRLAVMGATPERVGSTQRHGSITCATGAESDVYECLFRPPGPAAAGRAGLYILLMYLLSFFLSSFY